MDRLALPLLACLVAPAAPAPAPAPALARRVLCEGNTDYTLIDSTIP